MRLLPALPTLVATLATATVAATSAKDPPASEETVEKIVEYLEATKPAMDSKLSRDYLRKNAQYALKARNSNSWAKAVPWDLFLSDVAPYGVLTENRVDWRDSFFQTLSEVVGSDFNATTPNAGELRAPYTSPALTAKEAITRINQNTWHVFTEKIDKPDIVFIAAPPDEVNNYQVFDIINGTHTDGKPGSSCTGVAMFLAFSLRSVGIPARVAGTPHWDKGAKVCPHGDADAPCGNHNWVEVWVLGDGDAKDETNSADGSSAASAGGWHFLSPLDDGSSGSSASSAATASNGNQIRKKMSGLDEGWFVPYPSTVQTPLSGNHSIYATSWGVPKARGNGNTDSKSDDSDSDSITAQSATNSVSGAREWPADHYPMVWDWPAGHNLWNDHQIHGYDVTCRYHPEAAKCSGDGDVNGGSSAADMEADAEVEVLFV